MALLLLLLLPTAFALPNILMLSSDSMDGRVLDASQHLGRSVEMPFLRALAARGASFAKTYAHSPVCGPSRASALTSRFVSDIGAWSNYQELPGSPTGPDKGCVANYGAEQCEAWAQAFPLPAGILLDALAAAGYDVKVLGKVDIGANVPQRFQDAADQSDHEGPEMRTVPRGAGLLLNSMAWGGWSSDTNKSNAFADDANTTAEAVAWLRARGAGGSAAAAAAPFFLYMGLNIPHPPFETWAAWLGKVNKSSIHPPWLPTQAEAHPFDWHMSVSKGCAEPANTESSIMQIREVYLAMCAQADSFHGEVLAQLAASGLEDETLVIYWSDHGELAFDARQVLKDSFRDGSSRVPFIFAGPGVPAGLTVDAPASLLDLWPTLAELAGLPQPPGARGLSLVPAMRGGSRAEDYVVGQFFAENSDTGSFMLVQGHLKLIVFGRAFPWFSHYQPQLFNLTEDPDEKEDLAQRLPAVTQAMEALLVRALGESYLDIDARVMANDQFIFRRYLTANKTGAQVRADFEGTYKGFAEADWQRVLLWNATAPAVQALRQ